MQEEITILLEIQKILHRKCVSTALCFELLSYVVACKDEYMLTVLVFEHG